MDVRFSPLKQTEPTRENGVQLQYAPAKRTAYKARWYLILALALSPVFLFALWLYFSWVTVTSDGVVSMTPQKLVSPGEGIVDEIFVDVGETVHSGSPLIRIKAPVLDAEIAEIERELDILLGATKLNNPELERVLENKITAAKENQIKMAEQLEEYQQLYQAQIIQKEQLNQIEQLNFQAELWYKEAKSERLRELAAQQRDNISGSQANQVRQLRQQLVTLKARREMFVIRSTDTATVNDITAAEGDIVGGGKELMYLSARSEAKVIAYLEPKFVDFTQLDSKVSIVFPNGYSTEAFISQPVTLIRTLPSRLADPFENNRPVLKVTLSFSESLPERLRVEGLPVEVKHGNVVIDNPQYQAAYFKNWFN
ncbi:hypothetical protein [uncultured Pseudoteredinibacter sp.]|uniref:HlyD family secretion protein n=1 Tax=uncultured Pseudoteredinibacter sp. TaxID=1641701 RepID=UPI002618F326|nr:hypothetical protein [uncultured Pseudoteredinibacter sp.]